MMNFSHIFVIGSSGSRTLTFGFAHVMSMSLISATSNYCRLQVVRPSGSELHPQPPRSLKAYITFHITI